MTTREQPKRQPYEARFLAAGSPTKVSDGVWKTYTGQVVCTYIPELESDCNLDLVIDLSSLSVAGDTIPALFEHWSPVGCWREIAISSDGITGRLMLLDSSAESAGLPMFDQAKSLRLAIAQNFPWQASIGAKPGPEGKFEQIIAPTEVNGQTVTPDGDCPMYVLRGGVLFETSIVLFGADDQTGRIAASAPTTKPKPGVTMSEKPIKERLDALCTKLGADKRALIAVSLADGLADADVEVQLARAEATAKDAKITELQTQLAAATTKVSELETQLAALKPEGSGKSPVSGNGGTPTTPASRLAAMRAGVVGPDGKKLVGTAALNHLNATQPTLPIK